jgi:general secretion pathway protein E
MKEACVSTIDSAAKTKSTSPRSARTVREDLTQSLVESLAAEPGEAGPAAPVQVDALLRDALRESASDIHLDPHSDGLRVRLRIDGVMYDAALLAKQQGDRLINQFKTLADIDPVATFAPEEARIPYRVDDRRVDLRVTLAPCVEGSKFSIRVLERSSVEQHLDELGMREDDRESVERWLSGLSGMFVVTGPTGTGKTTTLYALLHELKLLDRSLITIEDPVEYQIDGINQIQIDESQGLTFARGIKTMLHLDPDYLLVGEMRDAVSARAAANAAATGRALMTTLHSADAVGTVTSLRNYGIEDHEIATNLAIVVAQRLVRTLCPECRTREKPTDDETRWLRANALDVPKETWHANGCSACRNTGFRGRTGLFEVWRLDEEDRDLILDGADALTIRDRLAGQGHSFLIADGLAKVEQGITTLSELRSGGSAGLPQTNGRLITSR